MIAVRLIELQMHCELYPDLGFEDGCIEVTYSASILDFRQILAILGIL